MTVSAEGAPALNSVRKLLQGQLQPFKAVLEQAYLAIARFQRERTSDKEAAMRQAIGQAIAFCTQFKPYIPPHKRRFIEIVEHAEALGLAPRDLIMAFDLAMGELHTRLERKVGSVGPWSAEMKEILDGRRAIPGDGQARNSSEEFVASGLCACGGQVTAPVRVLTSTDDGSSVLPGEIVACRMTSPEIVEVVERIAGIVTEQGGTLCHAAILAREFGVPCVVGCGPFVGTLRSGEIVVLDATSGLLMRPQQ